MCVDISLKVYELTRKLPKEFHVLSSQIARTADPVRMDFIENVCFQPENELRKHIAQANRSTMELVNSLYLAKKKHLVTEYEFHKLFKNYDGMTARFQGIVRFLG